MFLSVPYNAKTFDEAWVTFAQECTTLLFNLNTQKREGYYELSIGTIRIVLDTTHSYGWELRYYEELRNNNNQFLNERYVVYIRPHFQTGEVMATSIQRKYSYRYLGYN